MVGHSKWPQPCFAVITAYVAPIACMEATHWDTLRAVGLKDAGLEALQEVVEPRSQPFQFSAVHPGSPSCIKVAMSGAKGGRGGVWNERARAWGGK